MREIDKDPVYISILNIIHRYGKAYPDTIASKLGMTRQAIDYRLKRLVEEGYIEKRYNRRVYYVLTESGLKILSGVTDLVPDTERHTKGLSILKYVPILGISMGIITLGQFIALGDMLRGVVGFVSWTIIGFIAYYYLTKKIG